MADNTNADSGPPDTTGAPRGLGRGLGTQFVAGGDGGHGGWVKYVNGVRQHGAPTADEVPPNMDELILRMRAAQAEAVRRELLRERRRQAGPQR